MKKDSLYSDIECSDLHELPLYHLGLEWPVFDCLQKAGLETVGQLLELSAKELSHIPGLTLKMHFQISNRLFSPVCKELRGNGSSLAEADLSEDSHNALIESGVTTLGDLSEMSYVAILGIPGLEMRDVVRIQERLRKLANARLCSVDSGDSNSSSVAPEEGGDDSPVEEERPSAHEESSERRDAASPPCCPALVGDNTPIAALELCQRSHYALLKAGITTVGQLASISIQGLRDLRLINAGLSDQIQERLGRYEQDGPPQAEYPSGLKNTSLASLDLSDATHRALEREGIATLDQLARLSTEQILKIRGIDLESVVEIREKLDAHPIDRAESSTTSSSSDCGAATHLPKWESSDQDWGGMDAKSGPLLEALGLSTRAYNCLRRAGHRTVAEVARMSDEEIRGLRNVGEKTAGEIARALEDYLDAQPRPPAKGSDETDEEVGEAVEALGLSTRVFNALRRAGVDTIGQLARMSKHQIRGVRNVGEKAAGEIERALANYFRENPESGARMEAGKDEPPQLPPRLCEVTRSPILGVAVPGGRAPSPPTSRLIPPQLLEQARRTPVDDISIARLALPADLGDGLGSRGVDSIGDLVRSLEEGLSHERSVLQHLVRYLRWIVEQDAAVWEKEVAGEGISPVYRLLLLDATLTAQIEAWLGVLTAREREILRCRLGCDRPEMTLAEIGERLDLSRERIRQLEGRALKKLSWPEGRRIVEALAQCLVGEFVDAGGLMTEKEIRVSLPDLVPTGSVDAVWATRLLLEALDDFEPAATDGVWGLASAPLELVSEVKGALREILRSGGQLTSEQLLTRFSDTAVFREHGTEFSDGFVLACLRTDPGMIADGQDAWQLSRSQDRKQDDRVEAGVEIAQSSTQSILEGPPETLEDWENHLRPQVGQVELLGEIALTDQQRAHLGKLISSQVEALGHGRAVRTLWSQFPCALAVYLVAQGVYGYDGGDYWSEVVAVTGFSRPRVSQLGRAFEDILEALGLPLFYDLRAEGHRFVSLILAHGGIPNYCLPDFFANMLQASVLRAKYEDMSAAELIDEWRWRSSIRQFTDKPVIRFLIYGGRVAEDFVIRCRELARTYLDEGLMPDPDEVGLPRRVVEAYDEWIARQDAKQVEREETDRWGLRKPRVLVDPWGEGVVVDLPPQQVPATELYTDIAWKVTTDDRTDRVAVHVRRIGLDRKTEAEVFALSQPVEKVEVSLQVDGESKRTWRYQGVDEAHPMLVFDPEQGTLLSWSLSLPAAPLGLLYPAGTELSVQGEGRLVEELPRLPWGWSEFRGEMWDLTDASHLTLVRDGEEIVSVSLQPDEAAKRPFLVGGETFSPREREDRAPIYVGSPPRIRVPLAGRGSLDEELVRWRFNLQNKWSALPEIHKTTTLGELKPHLLVSEKHVDLPLSLPSLLGETPYGNFSVRVRGPLGRDAGFTLRMVPHLVVCGHQQLYLPDPQTGPPPATLLVETLAHSRIECRAEDTAQAVRTTERGETTWQHEVDVEADIAEVDLAVVRPRPSAESVRVPVRLPIRRLRWALVDEETATRRGVWTGDPIKRPIDALLQLQSPFLLVKLPLSGEDNVQMGLRMLDVEGAVLQVMDWDSLSHSRQLWRFDLSAFLDTVRASRSPLLRFELAIWGLPERSEPLRLPVLSLTQTLLVEDAELSARTADEQVFFDLTWRESVRLRSRRVRFWPLWRPWVPVFEQPIPDEAEGNLSFEVEPERLRSGKYRLEFLVVDPWAPVVETPHCPAPDAPSTVDVELISSNRQLDALQAQLERRGPGFGTLLERATIYHDIGEPGKASSDVQWCYEHLDDGTVSQMLVLDDLVCASGDKGLSRSLHLKLFAARRVDHLLAAREAGDVSADDFKSYLGKLPRSGLLPVSTCKLLLSVQDETARLRAVQQLIRRENRLGPRTVVSWVEDAEISDSDAVALLGLNPEFSADVLKHDLQNPIVSRLLESLAPQLGDKTPIVQPGTWVRTDAGWGRIDRIEDQDGEAVDQYLSGRNDYRLHVTLRPTVDAEPVVVDLPRKLIRFPRAEVIYTCVKCSRFSAQDCNLIVERHDYVAHGGMGPSFRKERVTFRSLRNLTYRARPPARRGLGI